MIKDRTVPLSRQQKIRLSLLPWQNKAAHNTRSALAELQSMFQARFEEEL